MDFKALRKRYGYSQEYVDMEKQPSSGKPATLEWLQKQHVF